MRLPTLLRRSRTIARMPKERIDIGLATLETGQRRILKRISTVEAEKTGILEKALTEPSREQQEIFALRYCQKNFAVKLQRKELNRINREWKILSIMQTLKGQQLQQRSSSVVSDLLNMNSEGFNRFMEGVFKGQYRDDDRARWILDELEGAIGLSEDEEDALETDEKEVLTMIERYRAMVHPGSIGETAAMVNEELNRHKRPGEGEALDG